MRDPERIPEIVPLLQAAWEKAPDLRLGQLICILSSMAECDDVFYMEEDKLLIGIQKFEESTMVKNKEGFS